MADKFFIVDGNWPITVPEERVQDVYAQALKNNNSIDDAQKHFTEDGKQFFILPKGAAGDNFVDMRKKAGKPLVTESQWIAGRPVRAKERELKKFGDPLDDSVFAPSQPKLPPVDFRGRTAATTPVQAPPPVAASPAAVRPVSQPAPQPVAPFVIDPIDSQIQTLESATNRPPPADRTAKVRHERDLIELEALRNQKKREAASAAMTQSSGDPARESSGTPPPSSGTAGVAPSSGGPIAAFRALQEKNRGLQAANPATPNPTGFKTQLDEARTALGLRDPRGTASTFGLESAENAAPMAGSVLGAKAGAMIPGPPLVKAGGALVGALGGGISTAWAQRKAQEAAVGKAFMEQSYDKARAQMRAEHPVASIAGTLAPQALGFSPKSLMTLSSQLAAVRGVKAAQFAKNPKAIAGLAGLVDSLVGAGFGAGAELHAQVRSGDYSSLRVAVQAAVNAIYTDPRFGSNQRAKDIAKELTRAVNDGFLRADDKPARQAEPLSRIEQAAADLEAALTAQPPKVDPTATAPTRPPIETKAAPVEPAPSGGRAAVEPPVVASEPQPAVVGKTPVPPPKADTGATKTFVRDDGKASITGDVVRETENSVDVRQADGKTSTLPRKFWAEKPQTPVESTAPAPARPQPIEQAAAPISERASEPAPTAPPGGSAETLTKPPELMTLDEHIAANSGEAVVDGAIGKAFDAGSPINASLVHPDSKQMMIDAGYVETDGIWRKTPKQPTAATPTEPLTTARGAAPVDSAKSPSSIARFEDSNGVAYEKRDGVWIDLGETNPALRGRITDPKAIARLNTESAATPPAGATDSPAVATPRRVQLKSSGPQTFTVEKVLPQSEVEAANGEQYFEVRNEKTGKVTTVEAGDIRGDVAAKDPNAVKAPGRDLDSELRAAGMEPSAFKSAKEKAAALKRATQKGVADKIEAGLRKAKVNTKGKAYDATIGLPIAVWNAAVDVAILAVRAGASVADAVTKAIDHIRKSRPMGGWNEKEVRLRLAAATEVDQRGGQPLQSREGGPSKSTTLDYDFAAKQTDPEREAYSVEVAARHTIDGKLDAPRAMKEALAIKDDAYRSFTLKTLITTLSGELAASQHAGAEPMAQDKIMRDIMELGAALTETKTQDAQGLQAQNRVNRDLLPHGGLLSYLGVWNQKLQSKAGDKFEKADPTTGEPGLAGKVAAALAESSKVADEVIAGKDYPDGGPDPDVVAESIIAKFARTQSDTQAWDDPATRNPIRESVRRYVAGEIDATGLRAELDDLYVSKPNIEKLASTASTEITARKTIDNVSKPGKGVARVRKAARDAGLNLDEIMRDLPVNQAARRADIMARAKGSEAFNNLPPKAQDLVVDSLNNAWESIRDGIAEKEIDRLIEMDPTATPQDKAKAKESIPRMLQQANLGLFDNGRFLDALSKAYGMTPIDGRTGAEFAELANRIQKAKNGVERRKAYREMLTKLNVMQDVNPIDLMQDIWYQSVLGNAGTLFTILAGSITTAFSHGVSNAGGALVRRHPKIAASILHQLAAGYYEGVLNAVDVAKTGDFTRSIDFEHDAIARLGNVGQSRHGGLEKLRTHGKTWGARRLGDISLVRRLLVGLDQVGAIAARDAEITYSAMITGDRVAIDKLMNRYRAGVNKAARVQAQQELGPTAKHVDVLFRKREILEAGIAQEHLDRARMAAKRAAQMAEPRTWIGLALNNMFRSADGLPKPGGMVARMVTQSQFIRSFINSVENNAEMMPIVGAGSLITGETHTPQGVRVKEFGKLDPVRKAHIIDRQLMGMAITALLAAKYLGDDEADEDDENEITGSFSNLSPDQMKQARARGELPYSIYNKRTHSSKPYAQNPLAMVYASVGYWRDHQRYGKTEEWNSQNFIKRMGNAMLSGMTVIGDISAISHLSNAAGFSSQARSDKEDSAKVLTRWGQTMTGTGVGFIPFSAAVRDVDKWLDPNMYSAGREPGFGAMLARVPFARRTVGEGAELDYRGRNIKQRNLPWRRWYVDADYFDDVDVEMQKRAARGVWLPPPPSRTLDIADAITGERREATEKEAYDRKALYLKNRSAWLESNIGRLAGMTDEDFADEIEGLEKDLRPTQSYTKSGTSAPTPTRRASESLPQPRNYQ